MAVNKKVILIGNSGLHQFAFIGNPSNPDVAVGDEIAYGCCGVFEIVVLVVEQQPGRVDFLSFVKNKIGYSRYLLFQVTRPEKTLHC